MSRKSPLRLGFLIQVRNESNGPNQLVFLCSFTWYHLVNYLLDLGSHTVFSNTTWLYLRIIKLWNHVNYHPLQHCTPLLARDDVVARRLAAESLLERRNCVNQITYGFYLLYFCVLTNIFWIGILFIRQPWYHILLLWLSHPLFLSVLFFPTRIGPWRR